MPGDFGEFTVNIGLGINFLAGGTLYLNSNDTLSYTLLKSKTTRFVSPQKAVFQAIFLQKIASHDQTVHF